MHPYLRHNVSAPHPSILDRMLANVRQKSQEYAHGNVYEMLIPTLTRQVMPGLWAYDLVELAPRHNSGFIQHASRHLYGKQVAGLVEELVISMNNHLVNQLYNVADEPPFTGDLRDRIRRCVEYPTDNWCLLNSAAWQQLRFDHTQSITTLDGIMMYHNRCLPDDAAVLVGNRTHGPIYRLSLPVVANQVFPIAGQSVLTFASQATFVQRGDVYRLMR